MAEDKDDEDFTLDRMDAPSDKHRTSKTKMSHKKILKKRLPEEKSSFGRSILYIFLVLLALVVIVNIYTIMNLKKDISEKKAVAEEEMRPANLNLYVLKDKTCTDCVDLSTLVGAVKNARVNIVLEKEVNLGTDEAKHLIVTYGLQRAPAVVLTGEIDKTAFNLFEKRADGLVYEPSIPPFVDVASGQVQGLVKATVINDTSCTQCFNIMQYIPLFKNAGFHISDIQTLDAKSEEGQNLIRTYKLGRLPAILLSKDMGIYPNITRVWNNLGTIEPDGTFVLRQANPPYLDLDTNKVRGLIGVTYLVDNSCKECYSVLLHKQILTNFGIMFGEETTYDINSDKGKEWQSRFNITKVPMVILDEEGSVYPSLVRVWNQVGTIEQGHFIFRRVESVGTYKDLNTGLVIQAKKQESAQQTTPPVSS